MVRTPAPIPAWHIVISGFLQRHGKINGMVRLWRELDEKFGEPKSRVELRAWNDNHADTAELVWRLLPAAMPRNVNIYAYSWGAGWGAMRLARELGNRGVTVNRMVLSDPVYRHPLRLFSALAFAPWRRVVVPMNVRHVSWFYQRRDWPRAVGVVGEKSQTFIGEGVQLNCTHQYADDAMPFHLESHQAAATVARVHGTRHGEL